MKLVRLLVLSLSLSLVCAKVWARDFNGVDLEGRPCHITDGYGPYDYTNPQHRSQNLPVVEANHFTPEVEQLIHGKSSGTVFGDLDYTLRSFPNHHRALFAIIRIATEPGNKGRGAVGTLTTPPECYLQRAVRFKPDDGKVYLLFGLYLHKLGKLPEAEAYYRNAVKLMPNSAEAHYNLGLVLTDQQKFAEAVPVARKAYQLGYPLAGLRKRLAAAGLPLTP